jgi:hypothetical protein
MTWALLKIAGLIAGWMELTLCALILLTIFIWVGDALRKVHKEYPGWLPGRLDRA